jgi:hypothetical protein
VTTTKKMAEMKAEMAKRLDRDLAFEVRGVDEEARTAEISLSSEDPYTRWFGPEILGHGPGEVDLGRLKSMGVLLWNHKQDVPIGQFVNVWLDEQDRKVRAVVKFDPDEQSDLIFSKVKSGTLKGVSVGYRVNNWEEVAPGKKSTCGRFDGPCYIARQWEPLEGSIVSVPADATVGVGRSLDGEELDTPEITGKDGDTRMTEEEKRALEAQKEAEKAAAAAEAETRTKGEVREIVGLCEQFNLKASDYLGKSVSEVKDAILALKAAESAASVVPAARTVVTADEKDKFRSAAIDSVCIRGGISLDKPAPGAADLRGMSLLDLARECVERAEIRLAKRYSKDELIRSAMGVDDFTYVLSGGINKAMMTGYQLAPATYQIWTKRGNLPDFKSNRRIQISEFGRLPEVKEHGEYTRAKLTDGGELIGLGTFGEIFAITRQALINDDLDALIGIPQKQGAAYRLTVNYWAYYELMNGLVGGAALYSSGNGNLTDSGSGGVPSVAQLANGLGLMTSQKDINDKQFLNIRPAFLICPVALETTALQLVGSVNDPSKSVPVPNPFQGRLTVVSDPNLDTAPAEWYLAAAPGLASTIEVAFLDGVETPTLEQQTGWNVDGTEFKVRGDFGVKVLDFRGLYKNKGA